MEQFRPIPDGEHKAKSPEAGAGPLGVSQGPEQPKPTKEISESNPPVKNPSLPKLPSAVFDCSWITPSPEEVESSLAEGLITEEEARQEKEKALGRQRWYEVGEMFEAGVITREEFLRLSREIRQFKDTEKWFIE